MEYFEHLWIGPKQEETQMQEHKLDQENISLLQRFPSFESQMTKSENWAVMNFVHVPSDVALLSMDIPFYFSLLFSVDSWKRICSSVLETLHYRKIPYRQISVISIQILDFYLIPMHWNEISLF